MGIGVSVRQAPLAVSIETMDAMGSASAKPPIVYTRPGVAAAAFCHL